MKRIAWMLGGLVIVATVGLVAWPLAGEQYALGLATGILFGGGLGMRLAEHRKPPGEGGQQ